MRVAHFEISIPKDAVSLSELLMASERYGLEIYRISTSFVGDEDNQKTLYSIIFKDIGNSFSNLIVYLSLFAEEYIPVGIYKNIE